MEEHIPYSVLIIALVILFLLSAFFSSSETALMSLDRHRLKHLADKNHRGAKLAQRLLKTPDRLIGLILLGNNFVNILITQVATYIGYIAYQDKGIAIATGVLTFMLLIFAEVMPKTVAAIKPEKIAFPASFIYTYLIKILYPLVWVVNLLANSLLKLFKEDPKNVQESIVGHEELVSIVRSNRTQINKSHQDMLLSVLSLKTATVEDIMIPRSQVSGVDLDDDWNNIEEQLLMSNFTRLLVYRGDLDNILGFVHLRKLLPLFKESKLDIDRLEKTIRPAYFTPENTTLAQQLINFQNERRRIALIVDEYGEIMGLVTLEDILEEIVGEFSTAPSTQLKQITHGKDGSAWMNGSMHVRDVNKQLGIKLPTNKGKTLNGLIMEHLQSVPVPDMSVLIEDYPIEIRKTRNHAVKTLIIYPKYEPDSKHGKS